MLKDSVAPIEQGMTDAEWQARCDLAACYRLVELFGWHDFFATHISLRIPGTEHFLLNPLGMLFDEITASALIKVDRGGNLLSNTEYPINPAGFNLHSAIHMLSAENNAVVHTHTAAGNAVACAKDGLLPLHQKALLIMGQIAYHDYEGISLNEEERARVVADLGKKKILILRNHGLLTVGHSIAQAFLWLWRIESACKFQVDFLSQGIEANPVPEDIQKLTFAQATAMHDPHGPEGGDAYWPALIRKLERSSGSDWRV